MSNEEVSSQAQVVPDTLKSFPITGSGLNVNELKETKLKVQFLSTDGVLPGLNRNPWLVAMVLGGLGVAHTRVIIIPRRQEFGKNCSAVRRQWFHSHRPLA